MDAMDVIKDAVVEISQLIELLRISIINTELIMGSMTTIAAIWSIIVKSHLQIVYLLQSFRILH